MPASPVNRGDLDKMSTPPPGKAMSASEMSNFTEDQPVTEAVQKLRQAAEALNAKQVGPEVGKANEDIEVPMEDRKEYIRTLLAGERFKKTYKLFDGNMTVVFQTRLASQNEEIRNAPSTDSHGKLRMLASLVSVKLSTGAIVDIGNMTSLDDIQFGAIYAAFIKFDQMCDVLFRKANDPNFWTRTAGVI